MPSLILHIDESLDFNFKKSDIKVIEKQMTEKHKNLLTKLLEIAKIKNLSSKDFRRYGSARSLYNFKIDNTY